MGITSKVFITSILVLITGILVHEYSPQHTQFLMKYPLFREAISLAHSFKITYFPKAVIKDKIKKPSSIPQERLFTADELKDYAGKEKDKGLYLAFLGVVYDVEKGKKFYGPEGGYSFFSGRDGSRAFVTGDFTEDGLIDDISKLTSSDYLGINDWVKFYEKDYKRVGKLIGRYYDVKGKPTSYNKLAKQWLKDAAHQKEIEKEERSLFPPCNSEWFAETGSRVYCTKKSGGVERDWVGVPRKLFSPAGKKERCACVKNLGPSSGNPSDNSDRGDLDYPNLKEYPGCGPQEESCNVPNK